MEEQEKSTERQQNPFSGWISSLTIRAKLILSFMVMILLTVAVIIIATTSEKITKTTMDRLVFEHNKIAKLSLDADKTLQVMQGFEKDFLLNYNTIGIQQAKEKYLNKLITAGGEAYQKLSSIEQISRSKEEKQSAQTAIEAINTYMASFIAVTNIFERQKDSEFGEITKLQQAAEALQKNVDTLTAPSIQISFKDITVILQKFLASASKDDADKALKDIAIFAKLAKESKLSAGVQAALTDQTADLAKWVGMVSETNQTIKEKIDAYQKAVIPIMQSFLAGAERNEQQAINDLEKKASLMQIVTIGMGIIAVIFGVVLAFALAKSLTRQIDHIMNLLGDMGMGDFSARTKVVSNDELGHMASSLNAMLDNITTLIQSQQERDSIQESIMKLMEEISDLTEGDLTARAEVTEDITGAIADSFNTMAEQFGDIVRKVKSATLAVDETATNVSQLTEDLADKSTGQTKQVVAAIESINQIAESIRKVSHSAAASAEVSAASRLNAREGASAVEKTNMAMDEIREQINETARSIKRLGESSMEIGNVVGIINSIADRTSILALNASIQAAMAGDAGHGFAVVAEEVQRLAESSSNSTKQIELLIKSIQSEIKDVSNRMDESISKVVHGSQLADGAYEKLHQIETVSNQLADLIDSITKEADEQVQLSAQVVKTMENVGGISGETSKTSQETAQRMNILNTTAGNLRQAVEMFKIEVSHAA